MVLFSSGWDSGKKPPEDAVLAILRAKGSNGGILPPICLREVGQNKPDVKERVEGRAQDT